MEMKKYELPALPFGYGDLAPAMGEEQLTIHHTKHHQAYVNGANSIFEKYEKAAAGELQLDIKAIAKELSFQAGGYILHDLFWKNLAPAGQGGEPVGMLLEALNENFGSLDKFKAAFTAGAMSVEGSGWIALVRCRQTGRLALMQIEKHNVNIIPEFEILLILDMFEHAYYVDYKNNKADYIENFWKIINWEAVSGRLA